MVGAPTKDAIEAAVIHALTGIAPEVDRAVLGPRTRLREDCDLDSMDFLNFVQALDKSLGVDIPEADYGRIATLEGCVAYLEARMAGAK